MSDADSAGASPRHPGPDRHRSAAVLGLCLRGLADRDALAREPARRGRLAFALHWLCRLSAYELRILLAFAAFPDLRPSLPAAFVGHPFGDAVLGTDPWPAPTEPPPDVSRAHLLGHAADALWPLLHAETLYEGEKARATLAAAIRDWCGLTDDEFVRFDRRLAANRAAAFPATVTMTGAELERFLKGNFVPKWLPDGARFGHDQ